MSADFESDLLVLLSDTSRHLRTYGDQMARRMGLTRAQLIVLARLERQPDLSQNELAELAEVAPITVARLIDRLEALGYVKRCTDPADRRIWRLRLTRAAAPVLREIRQYRIKLHRILTEAIEPEVLDVMRNGLRQMKRNVSRRRRLADAAA
ncbi:MAG TPA: MarR family transcriptional regulator [Stellaceae bacterium]|nr:MarR family transcriptional regulator [Stellaceae bacterium]